MLIAIMGNTFGERNEVGPMIMSRDHLRFVIGNYHLIRIAFPRPDDLKYIISATTAHVSTEISDEERRAYITDRIAKLEKNLSDKIRLNTEFNSEVSILTSEIFKNTEPKKK